MDSTTCILISPRKSLSAAGAGQRLFLAQKWPTQVEVWCQKTQQYGPNKSELDMAGTCSGRLALLSLHPSTSGHVEGGWRIYAGTCPLQEEGVPHGREVGGVNAVRRS